MIGGSEAGVHMAYDVHITRSALEELKAIRAFDRRQIADAIDAQLMHDPAIETKKRKLLEGIEPDFEHVPPIWQLRVGDFRVFYDVDETDKTVSVRAIREKPPHTQTEDII